MNTSLETLYLNDNNVTHFPSLRTTSNASNLRILDVKNNRIANIAIDQVQPLYLLWYLEISGNLLVEIDFVRYLPGLRYVYVGENPFPSTKLLSVETMNLESLSVPKIKLQMFPVIAGTREFLRKIDLQWNRITCIDVVHLSNMTCLQILLLGYNGIHKFPDSGCASDNSFIYTMGAWRFPSLQYIFLRHNKLTEVPNLRDAGLYSSEVRIDISANRISHVSVERLALLKNGTNVNLILSQNRITDMPHLSVLGPALAHAYLVKNQIAYLSNVHLTGLINLKTLYLSCNRIGSFDFSVLLIPPSLSEIYFDYNNFSKVPILPKAFANTSLTITLENNPIFCDKHVCSLVPEILNILLLTCAAPKKHNGRTLGAYYILMCSKYSIHSITYNLHDTLLKLLNPMFTSVTIFSQNVIALNENVRLSV